MGVCIYIIDCANVGVRALFCTVFGLRCFLECKIQMPFEICIVCFRMQNTRTHDQIQTCGFVMLNTYVHFTIPGNKRLLCYVKAVIVMYKIWKVCIKLLHEIVTVI